MAIHTEYRATTALGVDRDGNLRWQGPDCLAWLLDEQDAREVYTDILGLPGDRLTALMSRQVTDWEPVDGPIAPDGDLTPTYRAELWVTRTRGGEPQRSRVTIPKATFEAAESMKDIAHHRGDHGWSVYARLQSPVTILEKQGTPQPMRRPAGHVYNLTKESP